MGGMKLGYQSGGNPSQNPQNQVSNGSFSDQNTGNDNTTIGIPEHDLPTLPPLAGAITNNSNTNEWANQAAYQNSLGQNINYDISGKSNPFKATTIPTNSTLTSGVVGPRFGPNGSSLASAIPAAGGK